MKRVGAVICNFNKKEDVLNCIQSVLESKYTDYDLYVVDNASSDGSAEAIREKYGSQVKVLVNAENLGGSGGFNTGLRKALEKGYEYLYCLDNDVLVDENAMGELLAFLDTHPDSGMAGSRVYHMENPGVIQQFGQIVDFKDYCTEAKFLGKTDEDGIPDVEYSDAGAACSLMVRKSLIDEIGLMRKIIFSTGTIPSGDTAVTLQVTKWHQSAVPWCFTAWAQKKRSSTHFQHIMRGATGFISL